MSDQNAPTQGTQPEEESLLDKIVDTARDVVEKVVDVAQDVAHNIGEAVENVAEKVGLAQPDDEPKPEGDSTTPPSAA